ncbi:MAG: hypothetical protein ACD_14C00031G0003 [uncultured bacterium]|nr:MAG: hypothetical protein ACD_14C00031G0003 [uncultured bacterium]KKQ44100.1 MAG: hypothetical protein US63_C0034G0002 [Candidatus Moranbacteria bacterium GW2011_GWC2_37_8]
MFNFAFSQLALYLTFILVFFVPGIFLIFATGFHKKFSTLELFVLSFGSSIVIIDFLVILLGKSPLHITRASLFGTIVVFSAICFGIYRRRIRKNTSDNQEFKTKQMSRRAATLVVIILFLTIFIKTIYFKDAIFPTATDLGHHMYWTKEISITGQLPNYEKAEIGAEYTIEAPSPIADFIIGEHLFFAAIAIISGADFFSSFPVLTLFLIHIISILSIFVLTRAFFKNSLHQDAIAIITLLLIGPLYSIASPQAKFVSGGVIGNDIGNLLIPISILLYMKAFSEKKSDILAYALFISFGLAYTHHLSTFVFVFLSLFTVIAYAALNFKSVFSDIKEWLKLFLTREALLVLAMGAIFILFIYTPTYLNASAVNTAVGTPSKASRAGLTLAQLKSTAGEARFAFAFLGVVLLFFAKKLGKYNQAFMIGWIVALTLMSLRPDWLLLDIPSNRIASYIVFPSAIIAAYMFVVILTALKSEEKRRNYLSPIFIFISFFALSAFIATSGLYDNAASLNSSSSASPALQTYAASQYLADNLETRDVVLKDHNYLSGDAWIKLFFMKDYNYPLSRGFFKRYQDETKPREQCTNLMISIPNGTMAQKCFEGTGTNFIMVDPKMDSGQFHRLNDFWQIYSADAITVFYKKS